MEDWLLSRTFLLLHGQRIPCGPSGQGGPGGIQQARLCLCGVRLLSKTPTLLTHLSPALQSSPTTLKLFRSSTVDTTLRMAPLDSFKMGKVPFLPSSYLQMGHLQL